MNTSEPPPPTKGATIGFLLDNDCHMLPFKAVIGCSVHFRPAYISVYLICPEICSLVPCQVIRKSSSMADRRKKGKSFMVLERPRDADSCSWRAHRQTSVRKWEFTISAASETTVAAAEV